MITTQEAQQYINDSLIELTSVKVELHDSTGLVLDEKILADRDFPPFDRVMMDGIAIRGESFESGVRSYLIQDIHPAGSPAPSLQDNTYCFEVMTGAVLPIGCDTVIKYEDVEFLTEGGVRKAKVNYEEVVKGQHVHLQGTDREQDTTLIDQRLLIGPAEIGVLATVGISEVLVKQWPEVAIISSGDELVEVDQRPAPHQIRQSNGYAISSALSLKGVPTKRYHVADDRDSVVSKISEIMQDHRVIILSGGVSKGKKDYIPEALETNGVEKIFHRVSQRPGKPFWFGRSQNDHFVFAFPGNPVSTFVCYHRYFEPWLTKSAGLSEQPITLQLAEDFQFDPPLTYFLQVKVEIKDGVMLGMPVAGHGSGDLANLLEADGFLELPSDRNQFSKGEIFNYYPYRSLG